MELEELKASWNILDERLRQNEILNTRIIKEMITGRVLTAQQWLLWKNIIAYVIGLLALSLMAFNYFVLGIPFMLFVLVGGVTFLGMLIGVPAFVTISRFDINKPLKESWRGILLYQKSIRICFPFFLGLLLLLITYLFFFVWGETGLKGIFLYVLSFLVLLVGSIIEFRLDRSKLEAMKKGLNELKDFEEEKS